MPFEVAKRNYRSDYNLEVLRKHFQGHSMVKIAGYNAALTTTQIAVYPTGTTANLDQSGIAATPATVDVASTSAVDDSVGAGVQTLLLTGLSAAGVIQNETIITDGQTEVPSVLLYSAVTGLRALTWGANKTNAGTLWCGNGTFTAGVPATKYLAAGIGHNKSLSAYYAVPAGSELYLRHFAATVASPAKEEVNFLVEQSSDGATWFTDLIFHSNSEGAISPILSQEGIAQGQHVRITAKSSAAATVVSAVLSAELVARTSKS